MNQIIKELMPNSDTATKNDPFVDEVVMDFFEPKNEDELLISSRRDSGDGSPSRKKHPNSFAKFASMIFRN